MPTLGQMTFLISLFCNFLLMITLQFQIFKQYVRTVFEVHKHNSMANNCTSYYKFITN